MDPRRRTLLRVTVVGAQEDASAERRHVDDVVERLMGRKPEMRFAFIQQKARFVAAEELDV